MTHEYVIATGGLVPHARVPAGATDAPLATAIAWAAGAVLAVGSDEIVRAISRGDSTFVDLAGSVVTGPDPTEVLEPGAPADLDFWTEAPRPGHRQQPIASVRAGAFVAGDEHCGPFRRVVPAQDP